MDSTLAYYAKHARDFFDNTFDKEMGSVYRKFLPFVPPRGRILDAGCGSGRDSLYFLSRGYEVDAFDASKEMATLASLYINRTVQCHTFDDVTGIEVYDAVWAAASLLHLPFSSLPKSIGQIAKALKTDGIFFASFKYGDTEFTREGRHFTPLTTQRTGLLFDQISTLELFEVWLSDDLRQDRKGEKWLNLLARKVAHDNN